MQISARQGCGELHLPILWLGTIKIACYGPIPRDSLQGSAASWPSQAPRTESPNEGSTGATLNEAFASILHTSRMDVQQQTTQQSCATHDPGLLRDMLTPEQLNRQLQPSSEKQRYSHQYPSDVNANKITAQSDPNLSAIAAEVNDWAFQGVDMAFFDSLMRGWSE